MEITDPYEQQLLAVFESCDDYYQNSLSLDGLYQLCEKLQLEDHFHKLVKCVLGDAQSRRVNFHEFKDGLLKLLNNSEFDERNGRAISPARDVSRKYVFGKKYGRRSRPESAEKENHTVDEADDVHHGVLSSGSDNDSGSEESVPKKRKTRSFKRKEIQSTDGETKPRHSLLSPIPCPVSEEECLITAWSTVSGGIRNSLNRNELVNVFQYVGLQSGSEEAAQRVFEKLDVDDNGSITLQDLLEFIRSGVGWSKDMRNQDLESATCQKSANFEYFDSPALGCITGAYLVEQWENAGVPGASHLLHKLGLSETQQIEVSSLIALLSEELKILNDDKTRRNLDPSTALLLAISVLQNIHVQSLKSLIEHMGAEKEKLRSDVIEANQRALLLAQEIDEHHSKLEHSTQQQMKSLEQRHAEKIRDLTLQLRSEQDAQANQASQLEKKVAALEDERNKCKAVILQLKEENQTLEQEHRMVMDQMSTLQRVKETLEADLESLSNLQKKAAEMEAASNNREIMSLVEALETDNRNLRDRNDELSMKVEELSVQLHNASIKKRSSPVNSLSVSADESMDEGNFGSGGTKRRGDSFGLVESAEDSGGEEGSPRLGKVRKWSPVKDFALATTSLEGLQIHGVGRGECLEEDSPELTTAVQEEEVRFNGGRNRRNVSFPQEFQQVLDEADTKFVEEKMKLLEERFIRLDRNQSKELMGHVRDLLNAFKKERGPCEECSRTEEKLRLCEEEGRKSKAEMEEKTRKLEDWCKVLETSLDSLKEEYEKTEEYWSEKLEEERAMFEEEQRVNDKVYGELYDKIIKYEELIAAEKDHRPKLETIDEKDGFEKQVMDLEQECLDLRTQFAEAIKDKEAEIAKLKEEIKTARSSGEVHDASVQVTEVLNGGLNGLGNNSRTVTEGQGKKSKAHSRRSLTFSSGDRKSRYCGCCQSGKSGCGELKSLQDSKKKLEREVDALVAERNGVCKELMEKRRELSAYGFSGEAISSKLSEMEATLRHRQKQNEEILRSTWKQHKTEVEDLKSVLKMTEEKLKRQTEVIQEQLSKLARTDLLVKELFVENAYLVSSVQKLEQQCQTGSPRAIAPAWC